MKEKGGNSPWASVAGCLCVQLCVGILYLWSVFKTPVALHYGWTIQAANMVSSFMLFAFVLGNLIGGYLQDRTNPKRIATIGCAMFCGGIFLSSLLRHETISLIYFTYSVLGGLGSGFAYGSVLSCIQKWFPHRRGFASGLSVSAFGLSTVVFSPLSRWLMGLERFGDRGVPMTFRTLALVFFAVSMVACLFIRLPGARYLAGLKLPAAQKDAGSLSPGQAVRTFPFWCVALSCFFINGAWNIAVPLIRDLGMVRGLTESQAVLVVSLTGITNAAGRLIMAAVSDRIGRTRTILLLSVTTCVCALLMIAELGILFILAVLTLAFAFGGPSAVFPAMTTDHFGPKYSGTNYGLAMLALGLSSVVFNGLSSALLGTTGGYTASFLLAAGAGIVPVALMLALDRYTKRVRSARRAGSHRKK